MITKSSFKCTKEEEVAFERYRTDALSKKLVNTQKQADGFALKMIKEQRKAAAQMINQEKINYFKELGVTCTSDGNPKPTTKNVIAIIESLVESGIFKPIYMDEFTEQIKYGEDDISDIDKSMIANEVGQIMDSYISSQKLMDALNELSYKNRVNSVKEYLESLKWDETERISTAFIDYLGAKDCRLYREFSKKFFVAAVKRVYEPGCKFDNMIILTGGEGIGKSGFFTGLCHYNTKWYCGSLPLQDTESKEKARISWIVNIDELSGLNKRDATWVKNFLTEQSDNYRQKYGHFNKDYKRHCVFVGTTNEETFLRDNTSFTERRYWVIKCEAKRDDSEERLKKIVEEADQIWAEAVYYMKNEPDYKLYISGDLWNDFYKDQAQYKSDFDSDLNIFLEDVVNRPYSPFTNDNSLREQYKNGTLTAPVLQDKFTLNSLNLLLNQEHIIHRKNYLKIFAELHSDEWEYKKIKYNGSSVWGIYRIGKKPDTATVDDSDKNDLFKI